MSNTLQPKMQFLASADAEWFASVSADPRFERALTAGFAEWAFRRNQDPATHFRIEAVREYIQTLLSLPVPPTERKTPNSHYLEPQ